MKKFAVIIALTLIILMTLITYAGRLKKDLPAGRYKLICTDSIVINYPKNYLPSGITASYAIRIKNGYIWKDGGSGSYHQFDLKGKLLHSYTGQYKLCPDDNPKSYKKTPLRAGSLSIGNKYVYLYDDLSQYWFMYDMQGNFIKRLGKMDFGDMGLVSSENILTSNDTVLVCPVTLFDEKLKYNSPMLYLTSIVKRKTIKKLLEPDSILKHNKKRMPYTPLIPVHTENDFTTHEIFASFRHSYTIYKFNYIKGTVMTFGSIPPGYKNYSAMNFTEEKMNRGKVDSIINTHMRNWYFGQIIYNSKNKILGQTIYTPAVFNNTRIAYLQIYNSDTGKLITQIQLPDKYYNLCHITDDLEFWIENQKISRDTPYIIYKVKLVPDN